MEYINKTSAKTEPDDGDYTQTSDYLSIIKGIEAAQAHLDNQKNWAVYNKIPSPNETIRQKYGSQYSQNTAKDIAF